MGNGQRVLVIDGMHEIQEVLDAVLGPRGLRVDWMRSHVQRHGTNSDQAPDILVIDAEAVPVSAAHQPDGWSHIPRVILGTEDESAENPAGPRCSPCTCLAKPFQFPDLIQAIEDLLPEAA